MINNKDKCISQELYMNPKTLMFEVAERAYWNGMTRDFKYFGKSKPCDFWFNYLSENERNILNNLTSNDISNVRVDSFLF